MVGYLPPPPASVAQPRRPFGSTPPNRSRVLAVGRPRRGPQAAGAGMWPWGGSVPTPASLGTPKPTLSISRLRPHSEARSPPRTAVLSVEAGRPSGLGCVVQVRDEATASQTTPTAPERKRTRLSALSPSLLAKLVLGSRWRGGSEPAVLTPCRPTAPTDAQSSPLDSASKKEITRQLQFDDEEPGEELESVTISRTRLERMLSSLRQLSRGTALPGELNTPDLLSSHLSHP